MPYHGKWRWMMMMMAMHMVMDDDGSNGVIVIR
jgi:hypothetical protein